MKRPSIHVAGSHKGCIQAIKKCVAAFGGTVNVLHQSGKLAGSAGIPDLYIQIPRFKWAFWFEVKVGKDKLRPAQEAFIEREDACGATVHVGDLDEFRSVIRVEERRHRP